MNRLQWRCTDLGDGPTRWCNLAVLEASSSRQEHVWDAIIAAKDPLFDHRIITPKGNVTKFLAAYKSPPITDRYKPSVPLMLAALHRK